MTPAQPSGWDGHTDITPLALTGGFMVENSDLEKIVLGSVLGV